jgi:hypothetical protein
MIYQTGRCIECGTKITVYPDDDEERCLVCIRKADEELREKTRESAKGFWGKYGGG